MPFIFEPEHLDRAIEETFDQFREKATIKDLIAALSEGIQLFEDLAYDYAVSLILEVAEDYLLDRLGAFVGAQRLGLTDTQFRKIIRARIAAQRSNSTIGEIGHVLSLLTDASTLNYGPAYPASFRFYFVAGEGTLTDDEARRVSRVMELARPAGVGSEYIESAGDDADTFRLDTTPGLDGPGLGRIINSSWSAPVVPTPTMAEVFGSRLKGWWDFSDTSLLWKDTAGTMPVTADMDAVARADDKSGRTNNLLQGTGANQFAYRTSAVGSRGGIEYSGSGVNYMDVIGVASTEPYTLVFVLKDNGKIGTVFDPTTSRAGYTIVNSTAGAAESAGSVRVFNAVADASAGHPSNTSWILEVTIDATGGDFVRSNNATPDSIVVGVNTFEGETVRIGADATASATINYEGAIGEILVISGTLSTEERTSLYSYLTRWGL